MSAQVIFLNSWLNCPDEQRRMHQEMQDLINGEKIKLEQNTRHYSPWERCLSKMRSHNLFRDRMRLVKEDDIA